MKRLTCLLSALLLLAFSLTGCDLVGDVIEFSMWTLLIVVAMVVFVVIALVKALFD